MTAVSSQAALNFSFQYQSELPAEARTAMEDAAATLGSYFHDSATLVITVHTDSTIGLAKAEPTFPGVPDNFPDALVRSIAIVTGDTRINPADTAGHIKINPSGEWDYDDDVSADKFDFKSVVMHELIHTLGFIVLVKNDGSDSFAQIAGEQWSPFDRLLSDKDGKFIIEGDTLNLSRWTAVRDDGAGNGLFFNGSAARAANGGKPVGLYAPSTYQKASSFKHLDTDHPNDAFAGSLMLHEFPTGPRTRTLNAVERGILTDLGYTMTTPACNFSFMSPSPGPFSPTGGSGSIMFTVSSACAWSPTSSENWITITSGAGFGNGMVNYTVAPHVGSTTRSGSITIGNRSIIITQEGICPVTLTPTTVNVLSSGVLPENPLTVAIAADPGCSWNATTAENWITLREDSGTGAGSLSYSVAANPAGVERTGTISVNGQTHVVTQWASGKCSVALHADSEQVGGAGGEFTLHFDGSLECNAPPLFAPPQDSPSWISLGFPLADLLINRPRQFHQSVTVAPNESASPRSGTISVGDQTFTVNQAGGTGDTFSTAGNWTLTETSASSGGVRPPYTLFISQSGNLVTGNGVGAVQCVVVSGADEVDGTDGQVRFTVSGENCDPAGGVDTYSGVIVDGVLTGTFSRDTAPPVTGTFTMSRQDCTPTLFDPLRNEPLDNSSVQYPAAGGQGFVRATAPPDCDLSVASTAPWLRVIYNLSDNNFAFVQFEVTENSGDTARSGSLNIGNQTYTINQSAGSPLPAGSMAIVDSLRVPTSPFGGYASTGAQLAQPFVTGSQSREITAIQALLGANFIDPTVVSAELRADSDGSPASTILATLGQIPLPGPQPRIVTFTPTAATMLDADTQYWLILKAQNNDFQWFSSDDPESPFTGSGSVPKNSQQSLDSGANWFTYDPNYRFNLGVFGRTPEPKSTSLIVDTPTDELDSPRADGSGKTSLREAIRDLADGGVITFDSSLSGQTIRLTRGQLRLDHSVTIDCSALTTPVAISGDADLDGQPDVNEQRLFDIAAEISVNLTDLRLTHGVAEFPGTLPDQTDEMTRGGAIYNRGILTLINVSIHHCRATRFGGAIYNAGSGKLNMESSCLRQNHATDGGGAVANFGRFKATNCTIAKNSDSGSGAIRGSGGDDALVHLGYCTVSDNTNHAARAAGITALSGLLRIRNTIVAANKSDASTGRDIDGVLHMNGFNIVVSHSGATSGSGTSTTEGPRLDPLAYHGGRTQTYPPRIGSPALDAAVPYSSNQVLTDQRGAPRLIGSAPDVGAYELLQIPPPTIQSSAGNRSTQMTMNGQANITYRLQHTQNVRPPNWMTVATETSDSNGNAALLHTPPPAEKKGFYRILIGTEGP